MNTKGLRAEIFRWSLGDCSRNGISSRVQTVTIVSDDPNAEGQVFEPDADAPAVRVVRRKVFPGENEYVHLVPVEAGKEWTMHGGTYVYSSDSRFFELVGVRYPVALHDRIE